MTDKELIAHNERMYQIIEGYKKRLEDEINNAPTVQNEIRWTDKVWVDSQGNLQSMDGCPTDNMRGDKK